MANMTILEAAEHFGVSKEAIHNRVRRGSLEVTVIDGVKMVDVDSTAKPATKPRAKAQPRKAGGSKTSNDLYYKFLEEQNSFLHTKVEKLEGETRSLRDQKEEMLVQERIKIEQIYKEKDEQLKNILSTISSQFMLNEPMDREMPEEKKEETHLEAEIEIESPLVKGELISLKKYLKKYNFSDKKRDKIKEKVKKRSKKDKRIIVLSKKIYLDTIKYDYSDLIN